MLVSLIFLLLLTIGGLSLTYFFGKDETLLWRLSAGNVVGSTIFGLIVFLLACLFGFNQASISLSLLIALLPLILFGRKDWRERLANDWRAAKKNLEAADFGKFLRFAYYLFFFVLLWVFFERAILEKPDGIFTGASQNMGDLPFHLGAIFSFTEGNNFPPENPSYAFAKFTYPFVVDLITASFIKFGAGLREAMLLQNVFYGFSLLVVLEKFACKLTGNRQAAKLAPAILFFSGGLGFLWFFKDYWHSGKGLFEVLLNLPADYTITEKFRWSNSLTTLFITQRSLLLGMPLTLIVLQKLWNLFAAENKEQHREEIYSNKQDLQNEKPFTIHHSPFTIFIVGLLAGTLPLIHVHSLVVLFAVTAFLFFFALDRWREWIAFGVGVGVVAIPELVWSLTGSATRLTEFIDWHFGWDKGNKNFVVFWAENIGLFIPLLVAAIFLIWKTGTRERERGTDERTISSFIPHPSSLLLFYLPFAFLFFVSNAVKLAPWGWDNIKVLIYWFVGSIPLVALFLVWLWNKNWILKLVAAACFAALTLSGALDVWRVVTQQINYQIFDRDAMKVAEQIKQTTAPNALFLNAPTFNSAVVLSGRRSLMRYTGHLSSYGIDYQPREDDLKRIYTGDATAGVLLDKYRIEYVLISPEEKKAFPVNEAFFQKFPVVAAAGQYRVYKMRN